MWRVGRWEILYGCIIELVLESGKAQILFCPNEAPTIRNNACRIMDASVRK
jgi:hypothetical protein